MGYGGFGSEKEYEMKQCIDIYTGTYVDNKFKKVSGVGFAAICKGKSGASTVTEAYPDETSIIQVWMDEMALILRRIPADHTQFDGTTIIIHSWSMNLKQVTGKMQSIYDQLKGYDEDMWDVIPVKLRKKNGQYHPYHDSMVKILTSLLQHNQTMPLDVRFVSTSPKNKSEGGIMGLAWQKAETALKPA